MSTLYKLHLTLNKNIQNVQFFILNLSLSEENKHVLYTFVFLIELFLLIANHCPKQRPLKRLEDKRETEPLTTF